jgi:hypothetical protein
MVVCRQLEPEHGLGTVLAHSTTKTALTGAGNLVIHHVNREEASMMRKLFMSLAVALVLVTPGAAAWQKVAHLVTLPIIEGGGIYTSVMALRETNTNDTRAPAIVSLSLLGVNAAAGLTTMLGPQKNYPTMRLIHRSLGFAITAAAVWLSIAEASDMSLKTSTRGVCYGYTGLTMVPLIIFNF